MLKLEPIDRTLFHVESLRTEHIPEIRELWTAQYLAVRRKYGYLPQTWLHETASFSTVIEQHIGNDCGIVLTCRHAVVGFMAHDVFDFHGEKTAFFPIMAHAADPAYKLVAYSELYTHLSQRLVEQGCLNHIVTFFCDDQALQTYLFELGFGLYVVDAYRDLQPIPRGPTANDVLVRRATGQDVDGLFALGQEIEAYYARAPLFLRVERTGKSALLDMLASPQVAVFIAIVDKDIVGFMGIRCHDQRDVITLKDPTTASLDPLGAYIRGAYRGRGVGRSLLRQVVEWGRQQAITSIHVDFESANRYGHQFWPKHFVPILYSVRRHVNSDMCQATAAGNL